MSNTVQEIIGAGLEKKKALSKGELLNSWAVPLESGKAWMLTGQGKRE